MNLDDVVGAWRSQDLSPLYGVDKMLLHQVLQQEQANREKQLRRTRWVGYAGGAILLITSGLFLAIMTESQYDEVRIVWDYVVGVAGVGAAITVAYTLFALRRIRLTREHRFGDSLRDHVRRRIAQLDDEITRESRLALITLAAALIAVWAIGIVQKRIAHVPVPYSEFYWSPLPIILIFGFMYLMWLFKWGPRQRQRNAARMQQLEALLKELDDQ